MPEIKSNSPILIKFCVLIITLSNTFVNIIVIYPRRKSLSCGSSTAGIKSALCVGRSPTPNLGGVGNLCVIFLANLLMPENAYRPVFDRLQHIVFKILGIIDPVKDIHVRRSNAAKDIVDGVLGVFVIIQYGLCDGDHLLSVMPINFIKEFYFIRSVVRAYKQCKHQ